MTKSEFIKYWEMVEPVMSQKVNDRMVSVIECNLIDHCGGYALTYYPNHILWESEMAFLLASANVMCLSAQCVFGSGFIYIC